MTNITELTATISSQLTREYLIELLVKMIELYDYDTYCNFSDDELIDGACMMSNEEIINYINMLKED